MVVKDLITHLDQYPPDATVDAMFPEGSDAYPVHGTELITLADGRKLVVLDIQAGPHLRTA